MNYSRYVGEIRDLEEKILAEVFERIKNGPKLSTREVVDLVKLRLTLELLPYESEDFKKQVIQELYKIYTGKPEVKEKYTEWSYTPDVKKIREALNGRKQIVLRDLLSSESIRDRVFSYVWLRAHGVLHRGSRGRLDVNTKALNRAIKSNRPIYPSDVIKFLKEVPSRLWPYILTEEFLKSIDESLLISAIETYYGKNKIIDSRLKEEYLNRMTKDSSIASNGLYKAGKTISHKNMLSEVFGRIQESGRSPEVIASKIEDYPLNLRWKLVSMLYKSNPGYLDFLNPISMAVLPNPEKISEVAKSKAYLGASIKHYLTYLATGKSAEKDLALYYASRVNPGHLEERLRILLYSILGDDQKKLLYSVSRLYPDDTIELISMIVRDEYGAGVLNYEDIRKALVLGVRVFDEVRKGVRIRGRRRRASSGRLDLRSSLYNLIRLNYRLVFRNIPRKRNITALIDVSGSMLRYSIWTLIALASMIGFVDKIVLFWDEVEMIKPPARKTEIVVYRFLNRVYNLRFRGYTNISKALRASRFLSTGRIVVLVSDLQQTVEDVEPWVEASRLIDKGIRVIVIAPPRHNSKVLKKMESIGCDVLIVKNPSKIPILLKRRLNIKI
ncbi:VWA domain-containing protein [Thermogladius sp. 4427co]|uniref:vWA domain-containing protein n=1 Tax=Thermogladius sp. 4427co TaxID=3450718 RepID=UPI003F7A397C